jgi:hypothetical protein
LEAVRKEGRDQTSGLKAKGEGRWMRDDGRRRMKVRKSEVQKLRRSEDKRSGLKDKG